MGRKSAPSGWMIRRIIAAAHVGAVFRPDLETCSGITSTRLRTATPCVTGVRAPAGGGLHRRATLRYPVVQHGSPLTASLSRRSAGRDGSLARSPDRFPKEAASRGGAGGPNAAQPEIQPEHPLLTAALRRWQASR